MKFKYLFHQIPYSEFVVLAVENKVGHSMRYLFRSGTARVTFRKKGFLFSIGIRVQSENGQYYQASATHENLYAAIDRVQDKLEKQFLKYRKKIKSHKRPSLTKEGRLHLLDEGLGMDFSLYSKGSTRRAA